jgi:hypothetical protein
MSTRPGLPASTARPIDLVIHARHRRYPGSSSSDDSSGEDIPASLPRPPRRLEQSTLSPDLPWRSNDSASRLTPVSPARHPNNLHLSKPSSIGLPPPLPSPLPSLLPSPFRPSASTASGGEAPPLRHTRSAYLRPQIRARSGSTAPAPAASDSGRPSLSRQEDERSFTGGGPDSKSTWPLARVAATSVIYYGEADDDYNVDLTDHLVTMPLDLASPTTANATASLSKKRSPLFGSRLLKKKSSLPALRGLVWSPLRVTEPAPPDKAPVVLTAADLTPPAPVRPRCYTTTSDSQCPSAVSTRPRHEELADLRQSSLPTRARIPLVGRAASDPLLLTGPSAAARWNASASASTARPSCSASSTHVVPMSATSLSTHSLLNLPDNRSQLATPLPHTRLLSDEGTPVRSASSTTSSCASSALATPLAGPNCTNSHDTSPADRTSPTLLQARLASTRKLGRILGIEVPDVGQYADLIPLIPASPSSPEPSSRPLSSAFEYDDELDLAIAKASAEKDEPPRLVLKRETVDFAQTLLRLSDAEYAWADDVDRGLELCLADAPSDDQATPTTRNYIRPLTVDPFFSPPTALTPVQLELDSPLALALAFPLPPALPPSRQWSALVSRRPSTSRQLSRSQSYKRPAHASLAGQNLSVPTSPSSSALLSPLSRRSSARKVIKKQKSASALKESVRWATRSSSVVVVVRPTAEEQAARESSETMGFLTVSGQTSRCVSRPDDRPSLTADARSPPPSSSSSSSLPADVRPPAGLCARA